MRLPLNATSETEVFQYYATRARQLLHDGYAWSGHIEWATGFENEAYMTRFEHQVTGARYVSYYVLHSSRQKGLLRKLTASGEVVLTLKDCRIEDALKHVGAPFVVAGHITETREYALVTEFYGDKRARRSQVFLMNHIDEGLAVMSKVGASDEAMRAFCLHPLLQNDTDLAQNYTQVCSALECEPKGAYVLGLAMEYRSVANEYLAHCTMRTGGIRLSPLKDVNDMLIGDKVQNRKDFELYHAKTHENRVRLAQYFNEWCFALGVADKYPEIILDLLKY